jgi:hypothetical protein
VARPDGSQRSSSEVAARELPRDEQAHRNGSWFASDARIA